MLRKAVCLFLVILWLPACATLPSLFPTSQPVGGQVAEEDMFQKAETNYRHQAYRTAWQNYVSYLERYPQGRYATPARLREAELLGLLGDWQGSLRAYQRLLAREPEPEVALKVRYGIGRAYFKLGEYQQATQVLDNLTAADLPRSLWFPTQMLLSEIALKQGHLSQAFAAPPGGPGFTLGRSGMV